MWTYFKCGLVLWEFIAFQLTACLHWEEQSRCNLVFSKLPSKSHGPLWFMRGQHQREPGWVTRNVAEDKPPSYFFFSVIYGNVCRRNEAMNGSWWSQGYRMDVEPPVMDLDLLTQEQVVKWGADGGLQSIRLISGPAGLLYLFKAVPRRSLSPQKNEAIHQMELASLKMAFLKYQLSSAEVMILRHSETVNSNNKWILHLQLYLHQRTH